MAGVWGRGKKGGYLTAAQLERLAGIVAFTFTEKAAEELKLRLMARFGALGGDVRRDNPQFLPH
ncbi:MAG: hypothetical protein H5T86_00180 [Armatimonadetes bacterium]|nr:hypothetical protein [Armatimonadota bacterium]